MIKSIKTGLSFGLTSGIITTLGLIVGLNAGTHETAIVLGGIITIAIADAFSDALGIHMSEEAENRHTESEIWMTTFSTFFFKFIFAMSFAVPVLLLELSLAVVVSVIWGLSLICLISFFIAKESGKNIWEVVGEHLAISILVIILTQIVGQWISTNLI